MLSMAPIQMSAVDCFLLQVLVELAQERDEDIPALVYEARPVGRASNWQRQQQSPAELQGVTVEAPTQSFPTEGASLLCGGRAFWLLGCLCLLRSGDPNTRVDCCRRSQYTQLYLSTRSTLMDWGPASHLTQRTGGLTAAH